MTGVVVLLIVALGIWTAYGAVLSWLRRGAARAVVAGPGPKAPLPGDPIWSKWGPGVWGLVLDDELQKILTTDIAEATLAVSWGIADGSDLDAVVHAMKMEHPDLATWRCVRTAVLYRLAVAAKLVAAETATRALSDVAEELRGLHASWSAMGEAFVREHEGYMGLELEAANEVARKRLARFPQPAVVTQHAERLAATVWQELPFADARWVEPLATPES